MVVGVDGVAGEVFFSGVWWVLTSVLLGWGVRVFSLG